MTGETRRVPGVGSWIERHARTRPDAIAVVHGETRRSYAALAARVRRLATGLRGLGVERGERVVWLGANHPAFLETLFASATIGAVLTPINHRLDGDSVAELIRRYRPVASVVGPAASDVARGADLDRRILVDGASDDEIDYEALLAASSDELVHEEVALDDVCMVPHTSGTSGRPKGVMLTHGNVMWNVVNMLSVADLRSDDVTMAVAPFFRTGGTGVNVLPVLFKGGTVVVPEGSTPDEMLDLLDRHRVSIGFANPDVLEAWTRSPKWSSTDLGRVRLLITGGAPVPEHLIRVYMERGTTFLQGYGLSEAAPLVLLVDPEHALRKIGSAGTPPVLVDVRIVRSDGAECVPDETGELFVRGPNVMAGYWSDPQATKHAIDEGGWLRTGDAARRDVDGFIWIVDRVGDAYRSAGHVVYPGDVERAMADHPAVADVAVVARDAGADAFVVVATGCHATERELLEHGRARLPAHAVPRAVVFVDALPRSTVGKLLRHELAGMIPAGT